jgi:hypothetical protein
MVVERDPARSSIIDVLDRVLDKGIIVDASVRISLVGIELVGIDARVVVASVETYLRHADAIAFTALASPGARRRREIEAGKDEARRNDRRGHERRRPSERRQGVGRRIQNRRFAESPVSSERRSGPDRRQGNGRRRVPRRPSGERRAGFDRRREGAASV